MRRKDGTCSYISEETGVCRDVISRERTALGIGTDRVKSDRRPRRGQGFWRSIIWRGRRSSSVQTGRFSVELGRIHVATLSAIALSAVIRLRAFVFPAIHTVEYMKCWKFKFLSLRKYMYTN
jgi:hypothetical protein